MTIHLPPELEGGIQAEVLKGRFPSVDDAMAEAVRLLLQQQFHGNSIPAAGDPPALTVEQLADQEAQQRLFASGLLSEIKPPRRVSTGTEQFTPLMIQGEPLSETIIRERR
jgi:Arc/MetJ-type ribon-helix-helix transcriptional regulator